MKSVEVSAKTVDAAVADALAQLDATQDQVIIEVLDEGSKGFLGLLGAKDARVRVTMRDLVAEKAERAKEFLLQLLEKMGVNATVEAKSSDDTIELEMSGKNIGLVIGRRGATLDAIQYIVSLYANKEGEWNRILLDAEGYRNRRNETLRRLARKVGERVKKTGRRTVLEPMNPHERRIIHMTLQNEPRLATHSEGTEPYRRVVVTLKKGR